jgi:hypothetical protein
MAESSGCPDMRMIWSGFPASFDLDNDSRFFLDGSRKRRGAIGRAHDPIAFADDSPDDLLEEGFIIGYEKAGQTGA